MPPQPYPYFILTDGTDTVIFQDGAGGLPNWPLAANGWSPAIAGVRTSQLGGRGPYAEVEEQITCNVIGSTAALCYSNLDTLARLLDKAERWWLKNENLSPVLLKYVPQGSTLHSSAGTMLQAVVLGRAGSDERAGVEPPADIGESAGVLFEIYGVKIALMRRGMWGGASESASAAAVANPAVLSVTMPSAPSLPGSLKVELTGFTTFAGTGNIDIPSGFVFVGPNNSMNMQQAETAVSYGATGGNAPTTSTVADAAARASGGSVLRLTSVAAGALSQNILGWTLPASFLTANRIAVFCTYRNNSANAWIINAAGGTTAGAVGPIVDRTPRTPVITIPAAVSTYPQVLSLGEISHQYGFDTVEILVGTQNSVGGATFDIDTIATLDMSSGQVYTIALSGVNQTALGATYAGKNTEVSINYDPLTLRAPQASIPILTTSLILPVTYSGDASLVGSGSILQVMWYATHYFNLTTPYWTTQNVSGAAILSIGATITRRLAYLSPQ